MIGILGVLAGFLEPHFAPLTTKSRRDPFVTTEEVRQKGMKISRFYNLYSWLAGHLLLVAIGNLGKLRLNLQVISF